jgi:hypothetical protein
MNKACSTDRSTKTMPNPFWNTKFGPRRVREDPPTLAEAIAAARGMTTDVNEQVEIAASLIGLPPDEVRSEVLKAARLAERKAETVAFVGRPGAARTVVVERKPSRRPASRKGFERG